LQTVHGGVATAGGAVGTGASVVVDGALQLGTIVAGFGPAWIGLQPGRLSRSSRQLGRFSNKDKDWEISTDIDFLRPRELSPPVCSYSLRRCLAQLERGSPKEYQSQTCRYP